jgi:hypothetical protein
LSGEILPFLRQFIEIFLGFLGHAQSFELFALVQKNKFEVFDEFWVLVFVFFGANVDDEG